MTGSSKLDLLHASIDRRAAELSELHRDRLVCRRGCFDCCVDGITVFEIEAEKIRAGAADVLTSEPHPAGRCAFLGSEGECRVYELRPYVCRTQGLPLRWTDDEAETEYRDICTLNDKGEPIEELAPDACWSIGDVEEALARLQLETHGTLRRVALRDLFVRE